MTAGTIIDVQGQPSIVQAPLHGYRIATESYGALDPLERPAFDLGTVGIWNRFDTPGRTIYAAKSRRGAFTECLYDRRLDHGARSAIVFMAEQFECSFEDAFELYTEEQTLLGNMVPGWLNASWRESRKVYAVESTETLTWFDLSTEHSLTYIDKVLGSEIYKTCGIASIDDSHLRGDNRQVTALVATRLRAMSLENGGQANGIQFTSRHGIGTCWAYWMRGTDLGMAQEPVTSRPGRGFTLFDPDFNAVAKRFDINLR